MGTVHDGVEGAADGVIALAAVLCIGLLCAASAYGCTNTSNNNRLVKTQCIQHDGQWIDGKCIRR